MIRPSECQIVPAPAPRDSSRTCTTLALTSVSTPASAEFNCSNTPDTLVSFSNRDRKFLSLTPAHSADRYSRANAVAAQQRHQIIHVANGLSGHIDDHVAEHEAALVCWAARFDRHEH